MFYILSLIITQLCLLINLYSTEGYRMLHHRATIPENAPIGFELEFTKPIKVHTPFGSGKYCSYSRYKRNPELPFVVDVIDQVTGEAKIKLNEKLDYERKRKYIFEIAAKDCSSTLHGPREKIIVTVTDVNEASPQFEKSVYNIDVLEGKLFDNILELKPTDNDRSPENSNICHFDIVTSDVPFSITREGILYNTQRLNYSLVHNYILGITATDCALFNPRTSSVIEVNVNVKPICKGGWKDIEPLIEYSAGQGRTYLMPEARLENCDVCDSQETIAKVHLGASLIQKPCAMDPYSIQAQRQLCSASKFEKEMLPSPLIWSWANGDTASIDGTENDLKFDGTKSFDIPSMQVNHTLPLHFTFMTWLKHEKWAPKGLKEQIVCSSDARTMNRHHYSLFVRNCRLILLLRQEPNEENANTFKPAEWRFSLSQICDGNWHHYAISVDFPQVRLYVDGVLFVSEANNPEIIDDWPLHETRKINSTRLIVGACYQGSNSQLTQFFKGSLTGMSILRGSTENEEVIRCINSCHEQLDLNLDDVATGMTVGFNANRTEITITGQKTDHVEKQIRKLVYVNPRSEPQAGHRTFFINTQINCKNAEKKQLPEFISVLNVAKTATPEVRVFGSVAYGTTKEHLMDGVAFLDEIEIAIYSAGETRLSETLKRIDSCTIEAETALYLANERIKFPADLIESLGLKVVETEQGVVVDGIESPEKYTNVLRKMIYENNDTENFSKDGRLFNVKCSELNGRYKSSIYQITIFIDAIIKAIKEETVETNHAAVNKLSAEVVNVKFTDKNLDERAEKSFVHGKVAPTSTGMIIIVIVCIGFLIFMLGLGAVRIRNAHVKSNVQEEKAEMEWDHSALNITVNPLDDSNAPHIENAYDLRNAAMETDSSEEELSEFAENADESSDDDDDDDIDGDNNIHINNDKISRDCAINFRKPKTDLEWDDSTLTF